MIRSLAILVMIHAPVAAQETPPEPGRYQGYLGFNQGDNRGGAHWVQSIRVLDPAPRSEVDGEVMIRIQAPGMATARRSGCQRLGP
jgi:hypothetical protein